MDTKAITEILEQMINPPGQEKKGYLLLVVPIQYTGEGTAISNLGFEGILTVLETTLQSFENDGAEKIGKIELTEVNLH